MQFPAVFGLELLQEALQSLSNLYLHICLSRPTKMFHMKGKLTVHMPKKGDVNKKEINIIIIMCAIY